MAVEIMIAASLTDISEGKRSKGLSTEKLILMQLAGFANLDEGKCWPSYRKLAQRCHCDSSTVKAAVKRLEQKGFLRRVYRKKDDFSNETNLYYLINLTADEKYSHYPWATSCKSEKDKIDQKGLGDPSKLLTDSKHTEVSNIWGDVSNLYPSSNMHLPEGKTPLDIGAIKPPLSCNNTPRQGVYDDPETVSKTVSDTVIKTENKTDIKTDTRFTEKNLKNDTEDKCVIQTKHEDIVQTNFDLFMSKWPTRSRMTKLDLELVFSVWQELPELEDFYVMVIDTLDQEKQKRQLATGFSRWPSAEKWLLAKPWLANDSQLIENKMLTNKKAS